MALLPEYAEKIAYTTPAVKILGTKNREFFDNSPLDPIYALDKYSKDNAFMDEYLPLQVEGIS